MQWIGLIQCFAVSVFSGIALPVAVYAQQVIPDPALNTTVTSPNGRDFTITNGTAANQNLFHSFREFSVPTAGSATFNLVNTPNITTIFNRVTGTTASSIDGIIRTIHSSQPVTVFLLNPNGIVFGANAKLNISGSFVGTTANRIQFADGTEFSAADPPLLTITAPVGLQFAHAASITVQGSGHRLTTSNPIAAPYRYTQPHSGLAVPVNQTIALVGGDIMLNGGVLTAPEGRIELGGVRQGVVSLNPATGFAPSYGGVSEFGDVRLEQRSLADVNRINAGSIQVAGRQISLSDGSALWVQNRGTNPAGDIVVTASQLLKVVGSTPDVRVRSSIVNETVSAGANGSVQITAPHVLVQDGAMLESRNFGSAIGGTVNINAGQLEVVGSVPIVPDVFTLVGAFSFSTGNAGNVNITAQKISVRDGGSLGTGTGGTGTSGTVVINADTIEVKGTTPTLISSLIAASSLGLGGNGGNLIINTRSLTLRDSGLVTASSIGSGSAGNVVLNASEFVDIAGQISDSYRSAVSATIDFPKAGLRRLFGLGAQPQGNSGSVIINTPVLKLSQQGEVSVLNTGTGNAGTLKINADQILMNQGSIAAFTQAGQGGDILIQSKLIQLRQGSRIIAAAAGQGNGGNITLNAPVILGLENSDIVATAIAGRGGNIDITTQAILGLKYRDRLTPESDISASSQFGVSGTVQINNPDVNPNSGLVQLPNAIIDSNQQVANGCASNPGNRFVITGRGGLPTSPLEQSSRSDRPWTDLRDLVADRQIAESPMQAAQLITEATAWQRNAAGQIELIAQPAIAQAQPNHITCAIAP